MDLHPGLHLGISGSPVPGSRSMGLLFLWLYVDSYGCLLNAHRCPALLWHLCCACDPSSRRPDHPSYGSGHLVSTRDLGPYHDTILRTTVHRVVLVARMCVWQYTARCVLACMVPGPNACPHCALLPSMYGCGSIPPPLVDTDSWDSEYLGSYGLVLSVCWLIAMPCWHSSLCIAAAVQLAMPCL